MRSIAWLLALALCPAMSVTAAQDEGRTRERARHLFLEIESAVRLPVAQQAELLPHLYRDVCPALERLFIAHTVFGVPVMAPRRESPAQAADRIEQSGGWPMLGEAGRRRCKAFLTAHRDAVEELIREDLRAGSSRDQTWALHVVGETRAVRLMDLTIAALRKSDPDPVYAAQALREIDDPRAIPGLIRSVPHDPTQFFEALRSLQRNRPAHPLLLELLRSPDAKARWRALYALAESHDPVLVPLIPTLAADPSAEVRRQAGIMVAALDDAAYRRVRPSVRALLGDAEVAVRADVAVVVARRKDPASGPTLLALLEREDTLEPWRQSNVVQAIQNLTGSYFGLVPGTPSPEVRAKALAAFRAWIKEHPPDE